MPDDGTIYLTQTGRALCGEHVAEARAAGEAVMPVSRDHALYAIEQGSPIACAACGREPALSVRPAASEARRTPGGLCACGHVAEWHRPRRNPWTGGLADVCTHGGCGCQGFREAPIAPARLRRIGL